MSKRLLLIIDPQADFIDGTLPVPGAAEAIDSLAAYIAGQPNLYLHTIVTADHHPAGHRSFTANGGSWPVHCVAATPGADIRPALQQALRRASGGWSLLYKGQCPDTEEYSIFKNKVSANIILAIIERLKISTIDICGLAGDYCVADTITDALTLLPDKVKINVLTRFTASIDNGKTINSIITTLSNSQKLPLIPDTDD